MGWCWGISWIVLGCKMSLLTIDWQCVTTCAVSSAPLPNVGCLVSMVSPAHQWAHHRDPAHTAHNTRALTPPPPSPACKDLRSDSVEVLKWPGKFDHYPSKHKWWKLWQKWIPRHSSMIQQWSLIWSSKNLLCQTLWTSNKKLMEG